MKVITKIESIDVDGDTFRMIKTLKPESFNEFMWPASDQELKVSEVIELIKGRRIVNYTLGVDVILGIESEASKLLGLQYDAIEQMQKQSLAVFGDFTKCRNELYILSDKTMSLLQAGFWKRLKWLFTGVKS